MDRLSDVLPLCQRKVRSGWVGKPSSIDQFGAKTPSHERRDFARKEGVTQVSLSRKRKKNQEFGVPHPSLRASLT